MADSKISPRCYGGGGGGCGILLLILCSVALALVLAGRYGLDFDPARLPGGSDLRRSASAEEEHGTVLGESERVGEGLLRGPEDFAFDDDEGFMYTGCSDGWIKRVRVAEGAAAAVEDWAHVGGRPLGIALAPDGSLVVAEPYKGLLRVKKDAGEVSLLTDEAEGRSFKLTDGVDVASNGIIYFTDASYKYNLEMHMFDIFEGRPYGRLLSFHPSSNQTLVLAKDLYFPNGVSLSPDQLSLIFCETPLRRCRRYNIKGEKKGLIEDFVENLPGFPDNIRYDGEGHYWIALATGRSLLWDLLMKYPLLRKLKAVLGMHVNFPSLKNSGLIKVSLEGKPLSLFRDPKLSLVTGGLKVGKHLYFGSLVENYILRVEITKLAANA